MATQEEMQLGGIGQKYSFRPIIYIVIKNWYFYVLAFILCFCIAFLINNYSTPIYKVSATILIKNDQKNKNIGNNLLDDKTLSFLNYSTNISDEVQILLSRGMLASVIDRLDMFIDIYEIGRVKSKELYRKAPFRIEHNVKDSTYFGVPFFIYTVDNKRFQLVYATSNQKGIIKELYNYGQIVHTLAADFVVHLSDTIKKNFIEIPREYKFILNSKEALINFYQSAMKIKNIKETSVLDISLEGPNHAKSIDFLNQLCETYIDRELNEKNKIS